MAIDYFRKSQSLYSSTTNSFGTGTGETITPASVVGLPTDTMITLTFDRTVTGKIERIIGHISAGNFVIDERGVDGTSDQAHTSPTVEYIDNARDRDDLVDGILIGHDQTGIHKTALPLASPVLTTPKVVTGINDTNANELIKVTATASAVNELTLANAATGGQPTISTTGGDASIGLDIKLKGTDYLRKPTVVHIPAFGPATDTATGDGKAMFEVPEELNGMNITAVGAYVYTAGTTGTTDIQIRNVTQTADILSTLISIDSTEVSSRTAATPAVINTSEDDLQTGDRLAIDVDAIHSGTAAKGLTVWFRAELP